MKKSIRIGSGAGYAGDRVEPAMELLEKGKLDYIIFECLAERTIALGQKAKEKDPKRGYNHLLEYRMRKILKLVKEKNVKLVTNMGAANPKAAAEMTVKILKELGIQDMKVACVEGDDIYEALPQYWEEPVLELGTPLEQMKDSLISANAYMGAEGIIEALRGGAQIVITGRVSDPALIIAPLVFEFGWNTEENPYEMGQAVLAGHLLECAGQVTGGYYADPGYKEVPDLDRLGFPLVEIQEDGNFIVTKVEGSGGIVTTDTCKEQMLYEIHNPKCYMTPDAIADFSNVQFIQKEKDVVAVSGAGSHGRPETLKVSVGYKNCYVGEGEISYGGGNALARAKLAAEVVEKRLELVGVPIEELRIDFIGYNSLYKNKISDELQKEEPIEVRLRVSGRCQTRASAEMIGNEVEALGTNGPAGGGGFRKYLEEVISICSIFVPRESVNARVTYMEV